MKNTVRLLVVSLLAFLWASSVNLWAQGEMEGHLIVTGVVKDKQNKKPLENVNVSLFGSHIGTVTNADGLFTLKIRKEETAPVLELSHIGYQNVRVSPEGNRKSEIVVWMVPQASLLHEIVVFGNNPWAVIEEAIKKIPVNYSAKDDLLTGFYRETVQKGRRYISISEAVIDILKTSYEDRTADSDKVKIDKGRRLLSPKLSDTLAVKVVGGPNLSLYLDIVKNSEALLNRESLRYYDFWMEEPVMIANRLQYVIGFRPGVVLPYALFYGKLYIDREKFAFTRAEFNLDMSHKIKATQAILYKKPLRLRFKPQEVSFLITYNERDGKTYLNYIRNEMRFKCDWKKRLFSSGYTVLTEMVVTDRKEAERSVISNKAAFGAKQVFYDKVDEYWNPDFWGAYNILEPTESLEHAVDKLKKRSR